MLPMERRPRGEESGQNGCDGVGGDLPDGECATDVESILSSVEKSWSNDLLNILNPLSPIMR